MIKVTVPKLDQPLSVTYHDSCHLARGLGITTEPRKLLQDMGNDYVEMTDAATCCGFGGSFSLFHYDLSKRVNDAKIKKAQETNTDVIVAGCPGCVMHLEDGIHRAHGNQQVVNLIQLIAKADGGGQK